MKSIIVHDMSQLFVRHCVSTTRLSYEKETLSKQFSSFTIKLCIFISEY